MQRVSQELSLSTRLSREATLQKFDYVCFMSTLCALRCVCGAGLFPLQSRYLSTFLSGYILVQRRLMIKRQESADAIV